MRLEAWGNVLGNLTEIWSPTLEPRAAQATPLVPQGIATTINRGQSHIYEVPQNMRNDEITLSVCSFQGNDSTLSLKVNNTRFVTNQGVATLDMMSEFTTNGTITVQAPDDVPAGATWSYQIGSAGAGSYPGGKQLFFVDSDFANALFVTSPLDGLLRTWREVYDNASAVDALHAMRNITQIKTENLTVGIFPIDSPMMRLSRSYCAIAANELLNQNNADQSTTRRGQNKGYKSQFFVKGLNKSAEYFAIMGLPSPEKGYLGGTVFTPTTFLTKTSTSCQVIYNMSFCSDMAFAVPGNASSHTPRELTALYDSIASGRYKNFTKSLQQINCNTSIEKQFSPIRSCQDCADSYKDWLCTTTIPRCADMTNNASYLAVRPPGKSRNPLIDEVIQPGPYKEILPCKELCYSLVRDCPSVFQFGCPSGPQLALSYGEYTDDGDVTCSYPGAVYFESRGRYLVPSWILIGIMLLLIA